MDTAECLKRVSEIRTLLGDGLGRPERPPGLAGPMFSMTAYNRALTVLYQLEFDLCLDLALSKPARDQSGEPSHGDPA